MKTTYLFLENMDNVSVQTIEDAIVTVGLSVDHFIIEQYGIERANLLCDFDPNIPKLEITMLRLYLSSLVK